MKTILLGGTLIALIGLGSTVWWVQLADVTDTNVDIPPPLPKTDATPAIDDPAPGFTLADLSGQARSLDDFRGRYLLLNFWASYCPACRHEMPALEAVRRSHDLAVVGINTGENVPTIRAFLDQVEVSYPVAVDRTGSVSVAYRVHSLPATFLIDPRGRIQWRRFGAVSASQLATVLDTHVTKGATP